jgi:coatomer protein complex subunit gamma
LPIIEDAYVPVKANQLKTASTATVSSVVAAKTSSSSVIDDSSAIDPASVLYKIPEFVQLGRAFRSSRETPLTELEMEYVVKCTKHIFETHIVLQFSVLNTVDDQRLKNVIVNVEGYDEGYAIDHVIPAEVCRYGEPSNCFVSLLKTTDDPVPLTLACELKFTVVQVDPSSGEIEGDEDGYEEEFPLEELDINTNDYMAKVSFPDFRKLWEDMGNDGEVIEKFSLQFKKLADALVAVIDFLGMQPCDNTGTIPTSDAAKKSHTLHLSGMFIGNNTVLVRAQLQLDEANGVVLKMAVRSESKAISTLVAECIQ